MSAPPDAEVRKLTTEILARPEFAPLHRKLPPWVEWLRHLNLKLSLLRDTAPVLYWLLVTAAIVLCLAAIVHVVWTLRAALIAAEPPSDTPTARQPPDLVAEARELAASERYLEGAHRLMIASFHALGSHAVIELRPDRSNRWIRAELHNSGLAIKVVEELDRLVRRTEQLWFGSRANDRAIYTEWVDAWERLAGELR